MAKIFFIFISLFIFYQPLQAAELPLVEKFDLRTAHFRWDYNIDEKITEFRVKCGPTRGGPYPLVVNLPNPLARSFPVRGVITIQGEYACVMTAADGPRESKPTPELFFYAEASMLSPGNFRIDPNEPR